MIVPRAPIAVALLASLLFAAAAQTAAQAPQSPPRPARARDLPAASPQAPAAPRAPVPTPRGLSAEALDRSIALGREYLLNCQRPDGSFIYEMDAITGADLATRNAVREMGGLWAIAALHRQNPTPETLTAITRALRQQDGFARRTAAGGRYPCEPAAREWTTNAVALYATVA